MSKILSILLLYVFATTGYPVVNHYCSGKLVSSQVFGHSKGCGGSCSKAKPCCKDEKQLKKVDSKHLSDYHKITVKAQKSVFLPTINYYINFATTYKTKAYRFFVSYIPPPDLKVRKLHLFFKVFRI